MPRMQPQDSITARNIMPAHPVMARAPMSRDPIILDIAIPIGCAVGVIGLITDLNREKLRLCPGREQHRTGGENCDDDKFVQGFHNPRLSEALAEVNR